ncbi:AraC family transcriptional regulator [Algoriphagus resistens]|uniref:AraC family transcriptional regulator n=1 Tax=Algoriphagus resistens TaxID=1750590 RepID=UPI0009E705B5|nr:helix-turn-helix domain-containing protein [Algoriphagus resistens]
MVNVKLYPVHRSLAPHIRMIWSLDLSLTGEPIDLRMTADCYPHLVIRCEHAAEGLWLPDEGVVPMATFKGISLQSKTYKMSPDYSHIAVSFFPTGVRNIFRVDVIDTVNHLIEAGNLLPSEVIEEIILAPSHQVRSAMLNTILAKKLACQKHTVDNRIADFLIHHKSGYQAKLLEYNISERHFLRLFYRDVGINPKLFKRLYRFEEILNKIRNNHIDSFTGLAYEFGYADQSHFCKEFKMFTGQTPQEFVKADQVFEEQGAVDRPEGVGHIIGASL